MRALRTVVPSLATLAVAVPAASAGGYVSAGLGGGASLGGELETHFDTEDHDSGRLSLGHRSGPFAIEATYAGAGMTGRTDFFSARDYTSRTLGVDLKLHVGLAGNLEAYGKAGLSKTWLDAPPERDAFDYDGRGYDLGVGLQYGFDVVAGGLAVWLDYTRYQTDLRDGERPALDGSLGLLSLGLSLSFL